MERITSRQNPLMAHIRKLSASRAYREKTGEYLGDGTKLLEEALHWDAALTAVVCTEGTPLPPLPSGVRLVEVPGELMAYISPMEAPQGALFLAQMPEMGLPRTLAPGRYLALEGVQDPGNVGTILRTADAFDADGLFLLEGCADLYNPKTVRASMGAVFRRPVWRCALSQLLPLLRQAHLPLYGRGPLRRHPGRAGRRPAARGHPGGQRGPGPLPGGPGRLHHHGQDPHESPLRVPERRRRRRRPAVGGLALREGGGPMANIKYWVWLAQLSQIPGPMKTALLAHFASPEALYYADRAERALVEGITPKCLDALEDKSLDEVDRILGDCQRLGLRIVTREDTEYPDRLRSIFDPPLLLYVQGRMPVFDDEVAIAMVGTRQLHPLRGAGGGEPGV